MHDSIHSFSVEMPVADAELEIIRDTYLRIGEDFRFLPTDDPTLGYYIEPWSNQCLIGPPMAPGQPSPVSLEQSDDEIAQREEEIREWIGRVAHELVVADTVKQAPAGWQLKGHAYHDDWPETEFGASVLAFAIASPPPPVAGGSEEANESERERLLRVWRLHPDALVDLFCEEEQGGPDDGAGVIRMTEEDGTEVDEFRFASGEEADEAVDYALRAMNPGV